LQINVYSLKSEGRGIAKALENCQHWNQSVPQRCFMRNRHHQEFLAHFQHATALGNVAHTPPNHDFSTLLQRMRMASEAAFIAGRKAWSSLSWSECPLM